MTNILDRVSTALAGRYTIERELGRGGMAAVYLARDERDQRPVAIKVMLPEAVGNSGPERFRREIRIAARLTHPNIVTVLDSGEADQLFYYVMPFIEGESVSDSIVAGGPFEIKEAVAITRQAADALDYAHVEGVIHRDIKPANILLTRLPASTGEGGGARTPIVTDFGIAQAISGEGTARLTATGLMVGTPTYMSPEQATGERKLDGRSDQYSLACVLYEMLIGEPPFTGPTIAAVLARHTRESVSSLRIVRPMIPEPLEQAIFRAMSKAPASRFATMAEFADAIDAGSDGPIVGTTADYAVPVSTTVPLAARRRRAPRVAAHPAVHLMATSLVDSHAPTAAVEVPAAPRKENRGIVGGAAIALLRWVRLAVAFFPGKRRRARD